MRSAICILLTILTSANLFAQRELKDSSVSVTMVGAVYSFNFPRGDLKERFGPNSTIGGAVWHKTSSNWLFGLEYNFLFGSQVKEDPLDSIVTSEGELLTADGTYQLYGVYERGMLPLVKVGRVLPILSPNPNAGMTVKVGAGMLEHRIRYYWNGKTPPQMVGEYEKGYDRLTAGLALSQSLGWMYLDPRNSYNFSIDLEVSEAFTHSYRSYDYNTRMQDNRNRVDMFYGIKAGLYFPFYKKNSDGFYFE